jgi:hypothetical protein
MFHLSRRQDYTDFVHSIYYAYLIAGSQCIIAILNIILKEQACTRTYYVLGTRISSINSID